MNLAKIAMKTRWRENDLTDMEISRLLEREAFYQLKILRLFF